MSAPMLDLMLAHLEALAHRHGEDFEITVKKKGRSDE